MNEIIRQAAICEALSHFLSTPLYQKYGIKVDQSFFDQYEKNYDVKLNFIIDDEDKDEKNNANDCKIKFLKDGDGKISYAVDYETDDDGSDIEENIVNEVLLLDRNAESAKVAQIIAPGQDNKPVPWTTPHLGALCHPRIFEGYDLTADVSDTARIKSEVRRSDRRACETNYLLYSANKKMHSNLSAQVNVYLRQLKT